MQMSSHIEDACRMRVSDSPVDVFINKRGITTALVPAIREVVSRRRSSSWPIAVGAERRRRRPAPLGAAGVRELERPSVHRGCFSAGDPASV